MRDVRLVVQAVQSAEEAALAYAREIGEARRHLSEAIAHLDRADEARALLNRLAAGFGPQASGDPVTAPSESPAPAPARGFGGAAPGETSVTTPSPGIAIARPTGHFSGPRGSAGVEPSDQAGQSDDSTGGVDSGFAQASPQGAGDHGSTDGGDRGIEGGGHDIDGGGHRSGVSAHPESASHPPVSPPPRPGGWGAGSGQ
jgi:hypothetical protein